ncbi:ATP-binding protein, partial [bacterium]|nr:ATP-binding protein [bacterium]
TTQFKELALIKETLVSFAKKIDVVNMDNIPIQKTIDILKSKSPMKQKIVEFIKNADLDLDNFEYNKDALKKLKIEMNMSGDDVPNMEAALKAQKNLLDQLCLVSRHKGVDLPSVMIDSTGTKKIVALASYVIEAIEQGRILVVDELDSSLHFKLTRAIVSLFNNEVNKCGQLICTIHDISLLDCRKLFRKEQIWFIHRNTERVWLYSLSEFKAREHGTRDTTDIIEHYKKGLYGALPEPNLINTLLGV